MSITMTENAIRAASDAVNDDDAHPIGLRVAVVGGGCSGYSYGLDFVEDDDIDEDDSQLKFGGLTVYLDPHSAQMLGETEIDYVETLQRKGFVFNNPNAKTTCGCGSSFS